MHRRSFGQHTRRLDHHHRHDIQRRHPQGRVEGWPYLDKILLFRFGRPDADPLHLIGKVGRHQQLKRRWQDRPLHRWCADLQRGTNVIGRQQRMLVQNLHAIAQQDRRVQIRLAGGRQDEMQIEPKARVRKARSTGIPRGQAFVGKCRVVQDFPRIDVQPVAFDFLHQFVGRLTRHLQRSQRINAGIDQPVIQQVAQRGSNPGNGKRVGHPIVSSPDRPSGPGLLGPRDGASQRRQSARVAERSPGCGQW